MHVVVVSTLLLARVDRVSRPLCPHTPYTIAHYTHSLSNRGCADMNRESGGKNVIFSNCPYDQSKYSDPLIYLNMMSIKFRQ